MSKKIKMQNPRYRMQDEGHRGCRIHTGWIQYIKIQGRDEKIP
jgi:hypothetical protein